MPRFRIRQAAELAGVSEDTVRRWIAEGSLPVEKDEVGKQTIPGPDLAQFLVKQAERHSLRSLGSASDHLSARNSFAGLVTKITSDPVMSQVEIQCGPFRVVSLISTESVKEMNLEVGSFAIAGAKATNVTVRTI